MVDIIGTGIRCKERHLAHLEPTEIDEICEVIVHFPNNKSYYIDPLPTSKLGNGLYPILPIMTMFVTQCSSISLLLRKVGYNKELLMYHRPMCQLCFIPKLLNNVVRKLVEHPMIKNELQDTNKSVYPPFHSTETALTKLHNNVPTVIHS